MPVVVMAEVRAEDANPPEEAIATAVIAAVTTLTELAIPEVELKLHPVTASDADFDCVTGSWLPSPMARLPIAKSPIATRSPDLG